MNRYDRGVTNGALEGYLELESSGPLTTSCQARASLAARNPILSPSLAGLHKA